MSFYYNRKLSFTSESRRPDNTVTHARLFKYSGERYPFEYLGLQYLYIGATPCYRLDMRTFKSLSYLKTLYLRNFAQISHSLTNNSLIKLCILNSSIEVCISSPLRSLWLQNCFLLNTAINLSSSARLQKLHLIHCHAFGDSLYFACNVHFLQNVKILCNDFKVTPLHDIVLGKRIERMITDQYVEFMPINLLDRNFWSMRGDLSVYFSVVPFDILQLIGFYTFWIKGILPRNKNQNI